MKQIKVKKSKFKGIYVSVWFNKNFCWYCRKRPNTVSDQGSDYYIPLVFNKYMNKSEIFTYITNKILSKYNVNLANWACSIHCKYLWQVWDEDNKLYEVWFENNFSPDYGWWSVCKPKIIKEGNKLILKEGQKIYKYLPFRFIGSLFTMKYIIMFSDNEYQYVITKIINGDNK